MRPDHPRQVLSFVIEGEVDDRLASGLRTLIEGLAGSRRWTIGRPEFIDEEEDDEDGPARLVGGRLGIYSAWPPWNDHLPPEIDREQFQECDLLIRSLADFSAARHVEIALHLDRTNVGWIEDGEMGRSLAEGLLGEWRRTLGLGS